MFCFSTTLRFETRTTSNIERNLYVNRVFIIWYNRGNVLRKHLWKNVMEQNYETTFLNFFDKVKKRRTYDGSLECCKVFPPVLEVWYDTKRKTSYKNTSRRYVQQGLKKPSTTNKTLFFCLFSYAVGPYYSRFSFLGFWLFTTNFQDN